MTTQTATEKPCNPFLACSITQLALRAIIGGVFLQSGWAKLEVMPQFIKSVQNYELLPADLAYFYANALPWAEILAGVYLLLGLFIPFAALLTGSMLLSFLIAIGMVLLRGDAIDCGCFIGGKQEPVTWGLFFRDLLMLLGCVYLFKAKNPKFSLDSFTKD